ncbi:unnamed protein product [Closterium sp. Naga37s-1]|nr:unnamed protein product [Closterium sp. Naga37s-1]
MADRRMCVLSPGVHGAQFDDQVWEQFEDYDELAAPHAHRDAAGVVDASCDASHAARLRQVEVGETDGGRKDLSSGRLVDGPREARELAGCEGQGDARGLNGWGEQQGDGRVNGAGDSVGMGKHSPHARADHSAACAFPRAELPSSPDRQGGACADAMADGMASEPWGHEHASHVDELMRWVSTDVALMRCAPDVRVACRNIRSLVRMSHLTLPSRLPRAARRSAYGTDALSFPSADLLPLPSADPPSPSSADALPHLTRANLHSWWGPASDPSVPLPPAPALLDAACAFPSAGATDERCREEERRTAQVWAVEELEAEHEEGGDHARWGERAEGDGGAKAEGAVVSDADSEGATRAGYSSNGAAAAATHACVTQAHSCAPRTAAADGAPSREGGSSAARAASVSSGAAAETGAPGGSSPGGSSRCLSQARRRAATRRRREGEQRTTASRKLPLGQHAVPFPSLPHHFPNYCPPFFAPHAPLAPHMSAAPLLPLASSQPASARAASAAPTPSPAPYLYSRPPSHALPIPPCPAPTHLFRYFPPAHLPRLPHFPNYPLTSQPLLPAFPSRLLPPAHPCAPPQRPPVRATPSPPAGALSAAAAAASPHAGTGAVPEARARTAGAAGAVGTAGATGMAGTGSTTVGSVMQARAAAEQQKQQQALGHAMFALHQQRTPLLQQQQQHGAQTQAEQSAGSVGAEPKAACGSVGTGRGERAGTSAAASGAWQQQAAGACSDSQCSALLASSSSSRPHAASPSLSLSPAPTPRPRAAAHGPTVPPPTAGQAGRDKAVPHAPLPAASAPRPCTPRSPSALPTGSSAPPSLSPSSSSLPPPSSPSPLKPPMPGVWVLPHLPPPSPKRQGRADEWQGGQEGHMGNGEGRISRGAGGGTEGVEQQGGGQRVVSSPRVAEGTAAAANSTAAGAAAAEAAEAARRDGRDGAAGEDEARCTAATAAEVCAAASPGGSVRGAFESPDLPAPGGSVGGADEAVGGADMAVDGADEAVGSADAAERRSLARPKEEILEAQERSGVGEGEGEGMSCGLAEAHEAAAAAAAAATAAGGAGGTLQGSSEERGAAADAGEESEASGMSEGSEAAHCGEAGTAHAIQGHEEGRAVGGEGACAAAGEGGASGAVHGAQGGEGAGEGMEAAILHELESTVAKLAASSRRFIHEALLRLAQSAKGRSTVGAGAAGTHSSSATGGLRPSAGGDAGQGEQAAAMTDTETETVTATVTATATATGGGMGTGVGAGTGSSGMSSDEGRSHSEAGTGGAGMATASASEGAGVARGEESGTNHIDRAIANLLFRSPLLFGPSRPPASAALPLPAAPAAPPGHGASHHYPLPAAISPVPHVSPLHALPSASSLAPTACPPSAHAAAAATSTSSASSTASAAAVATAASVHSTPHGAAPGVLPVPMPMPMHAVPRAHPSAPATAPMHLASTPLHHSAAPLSAGPQQQRSTSPYLQHHAPTAAAPPFLRHPAPSVTPPPHMHPWMAWHAPPWGTAMAGVPSNPSAAVALISESQHAVDSLAADHMIATSSSSQFFLASLPDLSTIFNIFPNIDFESAMDTWQDVAFALQDSVDEFLYLASHLAESHDLAALSPATLAIIYVAGLLTSFAPCTLSLLPLTVGFIAGFDSPPPAPSPPQSASASPSSPPPCCCSADDSPPPLPDAPSARAASVPVNCFFFTLGLAATRTAMGVAAALAGQHVVGDVGSALPAAVSLVAMLAGLHLLGLLPVRLPAPVAARFSPAAVGGRVPVALQMAAGGAAFAFVAAPCCTPVLASLLAFVASTRDAATGGALLLSYTMGFATPLLLAASCTGALKQISAVRRYSGWINPASGALLLGGGAYVFVGKVLPHAAVMSTIM